MPRAMHAQGRPSTRVIPGDWNTTHSPVVDRAARGRCALRAPGDTQTWDGTEMQTSSTTPYWTGPCRVQAVGNGLAANSKITVEDREFTADYLVVVPHDVDALPGHLVDLLPQPSDVAGADGLLVGMTVRVEQVTFGTERWERDLFCTLVR